MTKEEAAKILNCSTDTPCGEVYVSYNRERWFILAREYPDQNVLAQLNAAFRTLCPEYQLDPIPGQPPYPPHPRPRWLKTLSGMISKILNLLISGLNKTIITIREGIPRIYSRVRHLQNTSVEIIKEKIKLLINSLNKIIKILMKGISAVQSYSKLPKKAQKTKPPTSPFKYFAHKKGFIFFLIGVVLIFLLVAAILLQPILIQNKMSTLIISTDAPCRVAVTNEEEKNLSAGKPAIWEIRHLGEYIIKAVSIECPGIIWKDTLNILSRNLIKIEISLKEKIANNPLDLIVQTDLSCKLNIDDKKITQLPTQGLKTVSIKPGEYNVKALYTLDNSIVWDTTIIVACDKQNQILIKLKPLKEKKGRRKPQPSKEPSDIIDTEVYSRSSERDTDFYLGREEYEKRNYSLAFKYFTSAAHLEHNEAMFMIALMYINGYGVNQDSTKAVEWYLKAARKGHLRSQFNLGIIYDDWKQYDKAAIWWRKAANQGLARAMLNLGFLYANGTGVPQDFVKAFEWFHKAAAKNNAEAQFNLGILYEYGLGVPSNINTAFEWYRQAANQGHKGGLTKVDSLRSTLRNN